MDKELIQGSDVVRLLLQFCKEHGLAKTFNSLREETDIKDNFVKDLEVFQQAFRAGRWDEVLLELNDMTIPRALLMDIYELILFELCEAEEFDLCRYIVKEVLVQKRLNEDHPERYNIISDIVTARKFNPGSYYAKESKQAKRDALFKEVLAEINPAKPGRLTYLLGKGLAQLRQENGQTAAGYRIMEDRFVEFEDLEDAPPNRVVKTIRMPVESRPTALAFTPNGKYLVLGTFDGFLEVWSASAKSLALDIKYQNDEVFMMHDCEIVQILPSRDSGFLAVADKNKKVNIWNVERGTVLKAFEKTHTHSITAMAFTPNEEQLITAAEDIKVWGLKSGRKVGELTGHESAVTSLHFLEDLLLSSSLDGTIKVWNLKVGKPTLTMSPSGSHVDKPIGIVDFCLLSIEKLLVTLENGSYALLNDAGKTLAKAKAEEEGSEFVAMAVAPHKSFGYFLTQTSYLYCFNLKSNKLEAFTKLSQAKITAMSHHPKKNLIAAITETSDILFLEP